MIVQLSGECVPALTWAPGQLLRWWQRESQQNTCSCQICSDNRRPAPNLALPYRTELPLAGDRRKVHHVVLEVAATSGAKTLRLLNEYTVSH